MAIEIDPLYSWVLLVSGLVGFECLIVGFIFGGGNRAKMFTQERLAEKWGDEHKKEFGKEIPKGGYPDHGNGRYSEVLTYKEWFEFNIDQRVHKNALEYVTIVCFNAMTLGLMWPVPALVLISCVFVGRLLYTVGYKRSVNGRIIGFVIFTLASLTMIVCNIIKLIQWMKAIQQSQSTDTTTTDQMITDM